MTDDFTMGSEALLPRVKEIFGAASKQFKPPSEGDCRRIADYLVNMRSYEKAKPRDYYYDRRALDAARRAGERFLAALAAVKEPDATDMWVAGMPVLNVTEVCEQVRQALRCLGETRHPLKFLDEHVTSAWAAANGGRAPRSAEKDKSPRVEVVAALYDLTKIEPAQIPHGTVSKILKGERRRGAL